MYTQNTFNIDTDFKKYSKYEDTKNIINIFMIWGILLSCVANLITLTPYGDITKFITNSIWLFGIFIFSGICYLALTVIINSVISHFVKGYDLLTTIVGFINISIGSVICCFIIF